MEYTYNIINQVYCWMIAGDKTAELRILKDKSEKILINDYITFNNQDVENRYVKVKVTNKIIFNNIDEIINNYNYQCITPNYSKDELKNLLNQIYGEQLLNKKLVVFEFEYLTSDLDIDLKEYKEPYIKELTKDKIINLTGQSGSGKSYYAKENFNNDNYLVVDTDDIFSDKRFNEANGINKELGLYFRNKYEILPNLSDEFDLIYNEIIEFCKDMNKIIVIDCAQFHCIKNVNNLKGKIIIIRTDIDTCYNRAISRWIKIHEDNNWSYTDEDLKAYSERKKAIYTWYKGTNEFIRKVYLIGLGNE